MSRHCRGMGAHKAHLDRRRSFRLWLLSMVRENSPKRETAITLALALGHADLLPAMGRQDILDRLSAEVFK